MMHPPPSAAALVIGNELLTGKVQDENVSQLARLLFELGINLERVVICRDEVDVIAADVDFLRARHDWVFTSGGVGPTHDDVTVHAVARSFGRSLVRSPEIEALLREFIGERLRKRHLRMALVPEGATLVHGSSGRWPVLSVDNVFVLPGLPEVFRRKLPILREHLAGGRPFLSRAVHLQSDEGEIAPLLERLDDEHPGVEIGSYPRWGAGPARVVVTFDGRDPQAVDRAVEALESVLPEARLADFDREAEAD